MELVVSADHQLRERRGHSSVGAQVRICYLRLVLDRGVVSCEEAGVGVNCVIVAGSVISVDVRGAKIAFREGQDKVAIGHCLLFG